MNNQKTKKIVTLCLTLKDDQILLAMKKRGFGVGRWNGFGGKVQNNETIEEAAKREILEESGMIAEVLEKYGTLDFTLGGRDFDLEVHIFKIVGWIGEPRESEEMRPQWFSLDQIPYAEMWSDDVYWLPLFLQDKKFSGKFVLNEKDEVISHSLNVN